MIKLTKDYEVSCISDLHDFGHTEDGTPYIGEVFKVMLENSHGDRYTHMHSFSGVQVEEGEFGYTYFLNIRKSAEAECERLAAKIKERGEVDLQFWNQARPAYGSDAYIEYGQDDDVMLEKMEG